LIKTYGQNQQILKNQLYVDQDFFHTNQKLVVSLRKIRTIHSICEILHAFIQQYQAMLIDKQQFFEKYNLLAIVGPTASGKTAFAARVAYELDGEILSADSRQVYIGMDIGTGKDLDDYIVNGKKIPYHLIDLVPAGHKYNLFQYQRDFFKAYQDVVSRGKFPIMCGGTGLYIDAIVRNYNLLEVPENPQLRSELEKKSMDELIQMLKSLKPKLHNKTDIDTKKRVIRAIEIELFYKQNPAKRTNYPTINALIVGIKFDRQTQRQRITQRLHARLQAGMIEEVQRLLDSGLTPEDLIYYGLEYKYITLYLTWQMDYQTMVQKLNTAIHKFMKRQMTWFRHMERLGVKIHWIDGALDMEQKLQRLAQIVNNCLKQN